MEHSHITHNTVEMSIIAAIAFALNNALRIVVVLARENKTKFDETSKLRYISFVFPTE